MPTDEVGIFTLRTIALAIMLFGMLSVLVNLLPGLVIIWAAAAGYILLTGLTWVNGLLLFVLTILMIGGSLVDNFIMGASARKQGASWWAIGAATLGGLVGSIVLPPFGGLLFALAALFIVEFTRLKDWRNALESTRSMALGCGWAVIVRFGIGVVMILLWIGWAFFLS